ncbi:MAG TPA: FAD-dependent oxidoreductase [Hyphomonadaceae bacterium]|jgi:phytoene dehydrogenase-like protein|nr:FAD-dependent oxidoreductase [Hyphomonadaceae bacterium]
MSVSSPISRQVNIVGGGIAGLLAAVDLARSGAKVTLFESAADLGGRARTRHADGFFLNQGPHALYIAGAFKRELDRLGIPYTGRRTEGGERQAIYRGELHRLPASLASLALTTLFGVGDKVAFARVQKSVIDGATGKENFALWMEGQDLSPVVRMGMEAISRVSSYANAPGVVHAGEMLEQIRRAFKGVIYLDGGWSTLVEGLKHAAREAGVEIRVGAGVERVTLEGRRSRVHLADMETVAADATLLALGPNEAARLCPGVASLKQYAADAIQVRANTLDLALSRLPDGAKPFALGIDQPFYFSVHSNDARLAPQGGAVVHVARYMAPDEVVRRDAIAELEGVADMVMPGWRAFEVRRQELRGMTVANATPRWDRPRPGVALPDAPGLFIAGDWVGDEGMIADAAAASAIAAARAVGAWIGAAAAQAA